MSYEFSDFKTACEFKLEVKTNPLHPVDYAPFFAFGQLELKVYVDDLLFSHHYPWWCEQIHDEGSLVIPNPIPLMSPELVEFYEPIVAQASIEYPSAKFRFVFDVKLV